MEVKQLVQVNFFLGMLFLVSVNATSELDGFKGCFEKCALERCPLHPKTCLIICGIQCGVEKDSVDVVVTKKNHCLLGCAVQRCSKKGTF